MTTWEYMTIYIRRDQSIDKTLNSYGATGWELVTYEYATYCGILKRPLNLP